jgi:uncharacterized protein with PIN domain
VFWQGTHYGDMERKIGRLLERRGRRPPDDGAED